MKQFLSHEDVGSIRDLVDQALSFKRAPLADYELGRGRSLGLVFMNPSLRTRLSTQKAATNLGMEVLVANLEGEGWGIETADGVVMDGKAGEHIKEAAAVLGEYCDVIGVRSFPGLKSRAADNETDLIAAFAKYSGRPVANLESVSGHPLQALADVVTVADQAQAGKKPKVVLTWAPHVKALPHAVPHSFAAFMGLWDVDLVVTHPKGYELDPRYLGAARVTYDQDEALADADFVYAKNWSSLERYGQILNRDTSWMVTKEKMSLTANGKFMHCLPVRRNLVVSDEVLDGPNSLVRMQAGNRVFATQAVLKSLLVDA